MINTPQQSEHDNSGNTSAAAAAAAADNEDVQLLLLSLDHLRSLRRKRQHHHSNNNNNKNKPQQDYLTLAIWALNKSISYSLLANDPRQGRPMNENEHDDDEYILDTDAFFTKPKESSSSSSSPSSDLVSKDDSILPKTSKMGISWTRNISIPTLSVMEHQILHAESQTTNLDELYPYNDMHPSNHYRFYKYNGLDNVPLTLPYLVQSALSHSLVKGMSRNRGYELLKQNELFQKFQEAVQAKGFFDVSEQDVMERFKGDNLLEQEKEGGGKTRGGRRRHGQRLTKMQKENIRKEILEERHEQVLEKFRQKLLETGMMDGWEEDAVGEDDKGGRNEEREGEGEETVVLIADDEDEATVADSVMGDGARGQSRAMAAARVDDNDRYENEENEENHEKAGGLFFSDSPYSSHVKSKRRMTSTSRSKRMSMMGNPTHQDLQEAEALKVQGNACMQQKKYDQAKEYYTKALELTPMGPTSHVFYSNRAAALLSMRNFTEAVWDAERSIQLKPDYPKAHARLGLARFLLGQYQDAVESYTRAVELEPTNVTSISYLEKSKKKVAAASLGTRNVSSSSVDKENEYDDIDDISLSSRRTITQRAKATVAKVNSRRLSIHASKSFASQQSDFAPQEYLPQQQSEPSFDVSLSENKLEEANRYKVEGNKAMARRDYTQAIQHYSKALRLAPAGPQSHVYFANRAAALCYLERYEEAELDAERALALEPEFSKAHARLGLSRYFLKDFQGAVEAYESAAMYDPANESNRIYLAKAKLKLEREQSTAARE